MPYRLNPTYYWLSFAGGLVIMATVGSATAQPLNRSVSQPVLQTQFHRVEQPLGLKLAVTGGGLALISLELWWFLFNHPSTERKQDSEVNPSEKLK